MMIVAVCEMYCINHVNHDSNGSPLIQTRFCSVTLALNISCERTILREVAVSRNQVYFEVTIYLYC